MKKVIITCLSILFMSTSCEKDNPSQIIEDNLENNKDNQAKYSVCDLEKTVNFENSNLFRSYSFYTKPMNFVIRTKEDLFKMTATINKESYLQPHHDENFEIDVEQLDLNNKTILGVVMGTKSSGGYGIFINEVVEKCDLIIVRYSEHYPNGEGYYTQAMENPMHFVAIPKTEKEIVFLKTDNTKAVPN